MARLILLLTALFSLAGCGSGDGTLKAAFIDNPADLFAPGSRLSPGAQHVRAAIRSGLVALDEKGEVVPALADRWIVTDDGLSFIFRLRDGRWPDGGNLTAQSVKAALDQAIRGVRGTSLGLELSPIAQVRAMAGRVVEIRLAEPVPSLLQLLAQPELGVTRDGARTDTGPMMLARRGAIAILTMKRPADRGLPEEADWQRRVRPVELRALTAERAIAQFARGDIDLVLGGRLAALPLAPTGPLSRGTVKLDPAIGLFGFQVRRASGFLADPRNREALAMALDRPALIAPFNIGGWVPTTRIVAPGMQNDAGTVSERWTGQVIEDLRAVAARRVAGWRAGNGGAPVRLTLAAAPGPGTDLLVRELSSQLGPIGVTLQRVPEGAPADLALIDRVARYPDLRWFLDQFNCSLRQGLCDEEADRSVSATAAELDPAKRAALLAQAETTLTQANGFIPFGSPIRFSLVRSSITGFDPNAWAFHPLPSLAAITK
ncbi:MAG: ABC transporter substrate-binding protein [Croceibacterium sp.]